MNAKNNQFIFKFPKIFIPDSINEKYEKFINIIPGSLIKKPIDLFNNSIQSLSLPGPSYDPVTQNDFPGNTRKYRSSLPTQELYDKTLTLTMQTVNGFINYWMCIEIFKYYYSLPGNEPHIKESIGLQMMDINGNLYVTAKLKEMLFTGISSLDLNFSSNAIEFNTFTLDFTYNILEIELNLL